MEIQFILNKKQVSVEVNADSVLIDVSLIRLQECEVRMRDNELRALYSMDRRKIQTFLFRTGGRC